MEKPLSGEDRRLVRSVTSVSRLDAANPRTAPRCTTASSRGYFRYSNAAMPRATGTSSRRAASAALTRSLRPLIAGPCDTLKSGGGVREGFQQAKPSSDLQPSAATRTASERRLVAKRRRLSGKDLRYEVAPASSSAILPASIRHERQVGIARPAASLSQHRMNLAAMMGLVIEHMGDQNPTRVRPFAFGRARIKGLLDGEPGVIDAIQVIRESLQIERLQPDLSPSQVKRIERSGMPTFGRGRSVKRPIQLWSPHRMWLSVLWIEPNQAPRSLRRSASDNSFATPYRFSFTGFGCGAPCAQTQRGRSNTLAERILDHGGECLEPGSSSVTRSVKTLYGRSRLPTYRGQQ